MKTVTILKYLIIILLVLPSWVSLKAEKALEISFYISPEGNDSQTGTSVGKPFATLGKARDAIRALKLKGELKLPVTVYLLGGTYELSEPFILRTEDSGTKACPITYRAYNNEKPVISGGREIKNKWEPYKDKIMVCTVPEAKDGKWKFRQLFLNGKRMDRARIPDKDNYYIAEKTSEDIGQSAMKFKEGDMQKWNNLDEAEIVIFHTWNDSRLFISNVDEQQRIVTFTGPIGRGLFSNNQPYSNRYYVENVLEGLDQPGEWYLDSHTGQLYLYPPEDHSESELRAPLISQLLILQGNLESEEYVQHVNFSGLTFSDAGCVLPEKGIPTIRDVGDIYKPSAITFDATKFCTFEDNCIRNVGTYAFEVTGDANTITWNKIYDTGGGGIITRSYGKEPNIISYNDIHDCGAIFYSACGINVDDGGGKIAHNLVHNISHTGIYGRHWGTETQDQERRNQEQTLLIEYNEIYRALIKMNDGGGIFVRDSNIIIRNNLIYDVYSYPLGGAIGFGIYLGCETRYSLIENNIIDRVTSGIHIWQGSRHNTIANNIIINAQLHSFRPANPNDWKSENIRIVRNIVYNIGSNVWAYSINKWASLPAESDYNIYWNPRECFLKMPFLRIAPSTPDNLKGFEGIEFFSDWQTLGFDKHSIVENPYFVNLSEGDYSLKPESPAFNLGFKAIDISNVGLRGVSR